MPAAPAYCNAPLHSAIYTVRLLTALWRVPLVPLVSNRPSKLDVCIEWHRHRTSFLVLTLWVVYHQYIRQLRWMQEEEKREPSPSPPYHQEITKCGVKKLFKNILWCTYLNLCTCLYLYLLLGKLVYYVPICLRFKI